MSAYQKEKMPAYPKKIDVDIHQNKVVNIPPMNNNQPSVPFNDPPKKVFKKSFNKSTVKDQVLTNNKDVGIPKRKDDSIPKKISTKVADVPSVHVNIPPSKNNIFKQTS